MLKIHLRSSSWLSLFASIFALYLFLNASLSFAESLPRLQTNHGAIQLMVDDKPFLVRGGELGNSTASNLDYLNDQWKKLNSLKLNTVVAPVYWDLIEPKQGQFDFGLVDGLIKQARSNQVKLVLLWFGSWKNSMSSYCPEWLKVDYQNYPRARDRNGQAFEILSPFYESNWQADARAFAALMAHLKKVDSKQRTVIMVQPENEIGMVDLAREYSAKANQAFEQDVPKALIEYLQKNKPNLSPELKVLWSNSKNALEGSWEQVFGSSLQTEELFMAWHFAAYTQRVSSAGKREYPLPMFANAALIRPGYQPGQYVSAGPLPHLLDIWRAAAPDIDFIAPDIYFPNFTEWTERYTQQGNPLFIPEALRNETAAVNALYAYAEHDALGFSPFGVESMSGVAANLMAGSNDLVAQLEDLILEYQGTGKMRGFLKISDQQKRPQLLRMGKYEMRVNFEFATPPPMANGVINESGDQSRGPKVPAGGLVIQTAEDEFIFAGIGLTITFDSIFAGEQAGIVHAESGHYRQGQWRNSLWNNGDQTHQGRHVRLVPGQFDIQRVKLYRYQ